jgi:ribosomal protein L37AE/L43A
VTGPTCPRCGVPARGLRSSVHIWMALPCGEWLTREQARVVAEASEKAEVRT